jgi:hypothetical protein
MPSRDPQRKQDSFGQELPQLLSGTGADRRPHHDFAPPPSDCASTGVDVRRSDVSLSAWKAKTRLPLRGTFPGNPH